MNTARIVGRTGEDMDSTAELVTAAIAAQRTGAIPNEEFSLLVKRYQDMVFGYAWARVHDAFLAEDITQETFITAYGKLSALRTPEAFPGWIRRIASRLCGAVCSENSLERLCADFPDGLESPYGDPLQSFESAAREDEIRESIGRLPEDQRVSIVLHYIDGYSQEEISLFLNIAPGTVRKRLQRGRDGMRKDLMNRVRNELAGVRPSRNDDLVERVAFFTEFEMAAESGQLGVLEQMLVDGVDVNRRDSSGKTLLHWAVESGHHDAVRLLLRSGADRAVTDARGMTPEAAARRKKDAVMLKFFEGGHE